MKGYLVTWLFSALLVSFWATMLGSMGVFFHTLFDGTTKGWNIERALIIAACIAVFSALFALWTHIDLFTTLDKWADKLEERLTEWGWK